MDGAYALQNNYNGIYLSNRIVKFLNIFTYTDAVIPPELPETLYLAHTQAEKESLKEKGYGTGEGSELRTIHEAQGLDAPNVIIIQTRDSVQKLHNSVQHAVVAISRHTRCCTYYTDTRDDAIWKLMRKSIDQDPSTILEYIKKRAIKHRDHRAMKELGLSSE